MHNKKYALKLVQDKLNGKNRYSYSQIGMLTGYKKLQIIRFSNLIKEKDIDSILVHGLTDKPSNNSPSTKEIEFIRNFKNQYPVVSISQFMDIYHEDVIFLNQNIYVKYLSKFYITKILENKISLSEKVRITKVDNQKILEQVLKEKNERLKARR